MASAPPQMPSHVKIAHAVLLVGFAAQVILGHLVAFGLGSPLFAWHQDRVALALWGSSEYGAQAGAYRDWVAALLGGTMISYAWAMIFIAAVPLRRGERWAAWAVAVASLNWFVVDTSRSAANGVWVNVAFNCVALASIAIPLLIMIPWLRRAGLRQAVPR